ncbi:Formyltransferase [Neoconidiobolus thromboides FSU 785]|nr:Formyltransferase [Neoconidiobolus thromboides FSU 785]
MLSLKHPRLTILFPAKLRFYSNYYPTSIKNNIPTPVNITFFGTDNFSIESIKALLHQKQIQNKIDSSSDLYINSIQVVTPPDGKSGRGYKILKPTPLKQYSLEQDLFVSHPPPKKIGLWQPDLDLKKNNLAIVVSFGYFLPTSLLNQFNFGGINLHPSLLPKYRGSAPLIHTMLNQDEIGGLSVQELSHLKFDAGKILLQEEIRIPKDIKYQELEKKMSIRGGELIINTLKNWYSLQESKYSQDETKVSKANKVDKEIMKINWELNTIEDILLKERTLGWRFPLHTTFRGQTIQLYINEKQPIEKIEENNNMNNNYTEEIIGSFKIDKKKNLLYIKCLPKHYLLVNNIKLINKNKMDIINFSNGYKLNNQNMERFI